jgi:hypothetical protein
MRERYQDKRPSSGNKSRHVWITPGRQNNVELNGELVVSELVGGVGSPQTQALLPLPNSEELPKEPLA